MNGCDSLDILAFCGGLFMEVKIDTGLASWVPDWERGFPRTMFPKNRVYNACGLGNPILPGLLEHIQRPRINTGSLIVQGFAIDLITELSGPCVVPLSLSTKAPRSWVPHEVDWLYPTDESRVDVFLKTIVADITNRDLASDFRRVGKARWDTECGTFATDYVDVGVVLVWCRLRCLAVTEKEYVALVSY